MVPTSLVGFLVGAANTLWFATAAEDVLRSAICNAGAGVVAGGHDRFFFGWGSRGAAGFTPLELHADLAARLAERERGEYDVGYEAEEGHGDSKFRGLCHRAVIIRDAADLDFAGGKETRSQPGQTDWERDETLIPVVVRLVGPLDRHSDVVGLLFRQLGQLHA